MNAQISELKLEIKEKESQIKELQRDLEIKDREHLTVIDALKAEITKKDQLMKQVRDEKENTIRSFKEGSLLSKRMNANMQKEMSIMSGVIHNIAYELY